VLENKKEIALEILKRLLGNPKKDFLSQNQYEFNCPSKICSNDKNKFNLNLKYSDDKPIFHCFKCGYHGVLFNIVSKYGTKDDINKISFLFPKISTEKYKKKYLEETNINPTCELPSEYIKLHDVKNKTNLYNKAINYLKKRRVGDEVIKKYELGYTESGNRKFRIICPSRNENGNINYYDARSFFPKTIPYLKPDSPEKLSIIFNEYNVNFDLPVYLVEGVFDMFPIFNCIPLLGKDLSPLLIKKLVQHKTKVILCLDEDAFDDTIRLYNELSSYGLDVYVVEVKYDIAKYYELYGKQELIKLLMSYKKPNFNFFYNKKLNSNKKVYSKNKKNTDQTEQELKKIKEELKDEQ
jgi:DNA primase